MSLFRSAFEFRKVTPPDVTAYGNGVGSGWSWSTGMVGHQTGTPVSTDQAMLSATVFACLRLISDGIATLPIDMFYRKGGQRFPWRPLPPYLTFQPPQGSMVDYLSQVMLSLLTDGNAYVLTPRDNLGIPTDLVVLDPTLVTVNRHKGVVTYKVQGTDVSATELMHIPGMKLPGAVTGVSPIAYARETISLDRDARRFGAAFFGNGALPGGIIEAPGEMTKQAAERFRDTWNASHQGVANSSKIGVLTEGAKFSQVSVNPDDAQFLATREFSVPEIARIFGVPPHLIGDASRSTSWGTGLAEQNLAFGQFSLRPWVVRIEDAHSRLLTTHGIPGGFVKLNLDSLLRASLKDRYAADAIGVQYGFLTINEARALEDLPPVPWGNEPYTPAPMTPTPPAATPLTDTPGAGA